MLQGQTHQGASCDCSHTCRWDPMCSELVHNPPCDMPKIFFEIGPEALRDVLRAAADAACIHCVQSLEALFEQCHESKWQ